jgi:hypothetical protein
MIVFENIEFIGVSGDWGAQIGWLSAPVPEAAIGLILHRMPVFRQVDTGEISFGMPLVPGDLLGSRYSCLTFDSDRHRRRLLGALEAALRAAHPEIFESEGPR